MRDIFGRILALFALVLIPQIAHAATPFLFNFSSDSPSLSTPALPEPGFSPYSKVYTSGLMRIDTNQWTSANINDGVLLVFSELGGVTLSKIGGGEFDLNSITLGFPTYSANNVIQVRTYNAGNDAYLNGYTDLLYDNEIFINLPFGSAENVALNLHSVNAVFFRMGMGSFTLDNITGTSSVPESATWTMMIAGFGLIGMSARRRQSMKIVLAIGGSNRTLGARV